MAAWLAAAIGIAACAGQSPTARSRCISARIGLMGGTLEGAAGTVVIPRGALASDTDVSLCVVEVGHVPGQFSDMVELSPIERVVGSPVTVTLPITAGSPASLVAEVRATPTSLLLASFPAHRDPTGAFATFEVDRFGDIRLLESSFVTDAGSSPPDTGERADAERPVGPVVVGRDLVPADYGCLGRDPTPPTGPARDVRVHVVDWADHGARHDYQVRAASEDDWWTTGSCDGHADCATGTTDAAGDVTLAIAPGPVFFEVADATRGETDMSRVAAMQWFAGVRNAATDSVIDLEAISQRTQIALNNATGFGGTWALGTIRDCAGAPVQRVRVRGFDEATEIVTSPIGTRPVAYGNGLGFPGGPATRSTIDGVFFYMPSNTSGFSPRIEAWGRLSIDGPDVLLACERISFLGGNGPTRVDLRPLRSDASPDCGSVP